jgi:hypothetical protein
MPNDTLTTIENQFFDGLQAVQEPTLEVARKAAELVAQLPLLDTASAITSQLPSPEEVIAHNFAFAQRLLDTQREFALQLATVAPEPAKASARSAKKSA